MKYRDFNGMQLSTLGMGNMRLPTVGGGFHSPVDEAKAREIIEYVYEQGVNYFDTAFLYHNGDSERTLGKVMRQYPRESWYLADKFWYQSMQPGWTMKDFFEEQLSRCGVDYFDFYLIHNVSDQTIGDYFELDKTQHMMEYLDAQKKAGRIKHLGFSCHSNAENMERFLDFHEFEFVQIQLNYVDWKLQEASRKYDILTERNIPIIVMEPCRGGRLASLGDECDARLKEARPEDSVAAWAFNFVQALPNVQVVLSGMTTMEQAIDNVATFSNPNPLTKQETHLLMELVKPLLSHVPCTSCRYCSEGEGCPQHLDIPGLIDIYNQHLFSPGPGIVWSTSEMKKEELPGACVSCGKCVKACPQSIDIPDVMLHFSKAIAHFSKMIQH